jgi:hypothetical protein
MYHYNIVVFEKDYSHHTQQAFIKLDIIKNIYICLQLRVQHEILSQ